MNKFTASLFTVLLLAFGCSEDQEKPKNNVQFKTTQVALTEKSTQRIELSFSRKTKSTDTLVVTLVNTSTSSTDYELSNPVENNQFVITAEQPYFDVTAAYDALPETDEVLQLEISSVDKGYKIGEQSTLLVTIKNYNISNNLVGEYLFTGNANDTSPGNSNDGTVNGPTLTVDRDGNANSAYSFDGLNDYITIPDNNQTDFNMTQDYSVSLWIEANEQTDLSASNNIILRKRNGSEGYPYGISLLNQSHPANPNEFYIEVYDGQTCGNGGNAYSGVISYNNFQHYVLVKQGNKIIQYLNGAKISEVTTNLSCGFSNNASITVGALNSLVRFFKGKIDDIRFYNAALSQELITELYEEVPN